MIYSERNQYKLKRIQWINVARREEKKKPYLPHWGTKLKPTHHPFIYKHKFIQIFIVTQIQSFLCTFVLLQCYKYYFTLLIPVTTQKPPEPKPKYAYKNP